MSSINSKITSPILNKNLLIKNTSFLMETKRKYNGFPTQIHSVNSNITDNPYLNPGLNLSSTEISLPTNFNLFTVNSINSTMFENSKLNMKLYETKSNFSRPHTIAANTIK